jgi:ribosome biogenesis GTPase / thiamine phosphate phosphatase
VLTFDLTDLGWDSGWAAAFAPYASDGLIPARVAIEFNYIYRLYAEVGELQAQHAGRMLHQAEGRQHLSAVGDWVAARPSPGEATATIEAVLPRRTHFSRKVAGELTEEQIVAANIDTVFLVMGLDGDYNPRRLERYLLLAHESGAAPVVLLSKADLAPALPDAMAEITALASSVPVHAISVVSGLGLGDVLSYMAVGRTGALLGSSGAGKSTLINALIGDARLATQEVRASDSRGRHTTRHRQLIVLPGKGLLIDTPGMRELQLWDRGEPVDGAFADIESVGEGCRFRDCRHAGEPGCAVIAAVGAGMLPAARLESYRKLQAEQAHQATQQEERGRLEVKRLGKVGAKALRKITKEKGR